MPSSPVAPTQPLQSFSKLQGTSAFPQVGSLLPGSVSLSTSALTATPPCSPLGFTVSLEVRSCQLVPSLQGLGPHFRDILNWHRWAGQGCLSAIPYFLSIVLAFQGTTFTRLLLDWVPSILNYILWQAVLLVLVPDSSSLVSKAQWILYITMCPATWLNIITSCNGCFIDWSDPYINKHVYCNKSILFYLVSFSLYPRTFGSSDLVDGVTINRERCLGLTTWLGRHPLTVVTKVLLPVGLRGSVYSVSIEINGWFSSLFF